MLDDITLETLLVVAAASFIGGIILYFIIKWAVEAPTHQLRKELEAQKRLLTKMLINEGMPRSEAISLAYNDDSDI